jgi:transcriptional regulator with XRE-family HTH domain
MEFSEKLQSLRKQKGLTQEELAEILYVSRTAVSKWESGRGMPNVESLKAIARYFSVTLDELLTGDELLTIAEDDHRKRETSLQDLMFGSLDCSMVLMLFLPFFGQIVDGVIEEVSLLRLTEVQRWLSASYFIVVAGLTLLGLLTLALQNGNFPFWVQNKRKLSLLLGGLAVFLFIISRQPYAGAFAFAFLMIKVLTLIKWR